jgi:hypothetical protein
VAALERRGDLAATNELVTILTERGQPIFIVLGIAPIALGRSWWSWRQYTDKSTKGSADIVG